MGNCRFSNKIEEEGFEAENHFYQTLSIALSLFHSLQFLYIEILICYGFIAALWMQEKHTQRDRGRESEWKWTSLFDARTTFLFEQFLQKVSKFALALKTIYPFLCDCWARCRSIFDRELCQLKRERQWEEEEEGAREWVRERDLI